MSQSIMFNKKDKIKDVSSIADTGVTSFNSIFLSNAKQKNSLDAVLDSDMSATWTNEMATPKKNIILDADQQDLDYEEFDNEYKKNVVRALFNPATNTYIKIPLPLLETYLEDTVDNLEKYENVSSRTFDTMDEMGLISIDMSPPITAKKESRRDLSKTNVHEHSVDISALESSSPPSPPVLSFNRKRCLEYGQYRTPYASNCVSPVMFGNGIYNNNNLFDDKNLNIDVNTPSGQDDSLLSPPILSSAQNHTTFQKNNVQFLSQSTPISHLLSSKKIKIVSSNMVKTGKRISAQMYNRKLDLSVNSSLTIKNQQGIKTFQKPKRFKFLKETDLDMNTEHEPVIDQNLEQISNEELLKSFELGQDSLFLNVLENEVDEKPSSPGITKRTPAIKKHKKELSTTEDTIINKNIENIEDDEPVSPGIANSTFKSPLRINRKEPKIIEEKSPNLLTVEEDEMRKNKASIVEYQDPASPVIASSVSKPVPKKSLDSHMDNTKKNNIHNEEKEEEITKSLETLKKHKKEQIKTNICLETPYSLQVKENMPQHDLQACSKVSSITIAPINRSTNDSISESLQLPYAKKVLPCRFSLNDIIINKSSTSFLYPKIKKQQRKKKCLDNISVIEIKHPHNKPDIKCNTPENKNTSHSSYKETLILPLSDISLSCLTSSVDKDNFLKTDNSITGFSLKNDNLIADISLRKDNGDDATSEINMDCLTQIPTELINSQLLDESTSAVQKLEEAVKETSFITKNISTSDHIFANKEKKFTHAMGNDFSGFQLAKENKVQIYEAASEAAEGKINGDKINNSKSTTEESGFTGFQTAKGNKVKISENALKIAKEKFIADEINTLKPQTKKPGAGFQTAKCNKFQIFENVLKNAKDIADEINTPKPPTSNPRFTGFQTAKGNKVRISEDALKTAKEKFVVGEINNPKPPTANPRFTGFQTAKGNKVRISEDALKAAREKFIADEINNPKPPTSNPRFTGFQTAKGSNVQVSEDALKAAREKFIADEINNPKPPTSNPRFTGFQTAKGSKVQVSEDALKAAKEKLIADEINTPKPQTKNPGFQTAKGSRVEISEDALKAAKEKFISDEKNNTLKPPSKPPSKGFTGFQTAKGSNVQISKDALKAAKEKFTREKNDNLKLAIETKTPKQGNATKSPERNLVEIHTSRTQFNQSVNRNGGEMQHKPSGTERKSIFTDPTVYVSDRFAVQNASLHSCRADPDKEMQKTPVGNYKNSSKLFSFPKTGSSIPFHVPIKSHQQQQEVGFGSKRKLFSYSPFQRKRVKMSDKVEEETCGAKNEMKQVNLRTQSDGKFYCSKKEAKKSFLEYVNYCCPESCSRKELLNYGITEDVINITGNNAADYEFDARKFFSSGAVHEKTFILCDGMTCSCDDNFMIGVGEVKKALLNCDVVEEKLVVAGWVENHYKHIVWKLASYERGYPEQCAGRALTPFNVMHQLKYRYDKEIDHAERSCVKRIFERDGVPSCRMVLFVGKLNVPASTGNTDNNESNQGSSDKSKNIIELSDGWYDIRACIDQPLTSLIKDGRITVGTKLCIYGAELQAGVTDGCPPLEGLEKISLVLTANSTRRSTWDTKLGFQPQKMAFTVPLSSLYPDGGTVGVVNVTIVRRYPCQWMEKVDGRCIFRTTQSEDKAKKRYEELKRSKMEDVYEGVQADLENVELKVRKGKRRSYTAKEISQQRDGKDIYDLIQNSIEPSAIEASLTGSQRELLIDYKQKKHTLQQDKIMQKFNMKWRKICQDEFYERTVIQLQRYRIVDNYESSKNEQKKDTILTIWKPTQDVTERLKEGTQVEIYHLNTSQSRYKQCNCKFQLSTTNSTKYKFQDDKDNEKGNVYVSRQVHSTKHLYKSPASVTYGEIDVVGYVLFVSSPIHSREQMVYLCDGSNKYLAVKFWNGLKAFEVEDMTKEDVKLSFTSLYIGKYPKFYNGILQVEYTDLSTISRNSKLSRIENAMKGFTKFLANNKGYTNSMKKRLQFILQTDRSKPKTPLANSSVGNERSNSMLEKPITPSPSTGPAVKTAMSEKLPSENLRPRHKLQIKKRLSLQRFREPPDLHALNNSDASVVTSQFKPPSSSTKKKQPDSAVL